MLQLEMAWFFWTKPLGRSEIEKQKPRKVKVTTNSHSSYKTQEWLMGQDSWSQSTSLSILPITNIKTAFLHFWLDDIKIHLLWKSKYYEMYSTTQRSLYVPKSANYFHSVSYLVLVIYFIFFSQLKIAVTQWFPVSEVYLKSNVIKK